MKKTLKLTLLIVAVVTTLVTVGYATTVDGPGEDVPHCTQVD